MSYDIQYASILDQHQHLIKRYTARAFEEFIFLVAPVELTHPTNLSLRVPFVNNTIDGRAKCGPMGRDHDTSKHKTVQVLSRIDRIADEEHALMDSKTLSHRQTRRTTLTLEADVADYIAEKLGGNKRLKEKTVVNDLLRKGIRTEVEAAERTRFEIKGFTSNFASGIDAASLEQMLDEI